MYVKEVTSVWNKNSLDGVCGLFLGFSLFLEALVQPSNSVSAHYNMVKKVILHHVIVRKKKMNFGITLAFLV